MAFRRRGFRRRFGRRRAFRRGRRYRRRFVNKRRVRRIKAGRRKNLRHQIMSEIVQFDPEIPAGLDYWQAPEYSSTPITAESAGTCGFGLTQMQLTLARWLGTQFSEFRIKSVWFEFIPKYSRAQMSSYIANESFVGGTGDVSNRIQPGTPGWWFYKPGAVNLPLTPVSLNQSEVFAQQGAFKRYPWQRFKISVPLVRWVHTYYGSASADNTAGQNQQYPDYAVSVKNRWMSLQPQGATYLWRVKGFQWCSETQYLGSTDLAGQLANIQPWRIVGHARCDVRRPIVAEAGALLLSSQKAEIRAKREAMYEARMDDLREARLLASVKRAVRVERMLEKEREAMAGPMSQDTSTMDVDSEESEIEEEGVATK